MEFDWSQEDALHRDEIRRFLDEVLPDDWEEISKHGPGSDAQAAFSKTFRHGFRLNQLGSHGLPVKYGKSSRIVLLSAMSGGTWQLAPELPQQARTMGHQRAGQAFRCIRHSPMNQ